MFTLNFYLIFFGGFVKELAEVMEFFNQQVNGLAVPPISPECLVCTTRPPGMIGGAGNIQTDDFLQMLGLPHIWTEPSNSTRPIVKDPLPQYESAGQYTHSFDANEINIDEGDETNETLHSAAKNNDKVQYQDNNEINIDDF